LNRSLLDAGCNISTNKYTLFDGMVQLRLKIMQIESLTV